MRWLDINLPEPGNHPSMDEAVADVRARYATLPEIQQRDGLDAVTVTSIMDEIGCRLFQAVREVAPKAFVPERQAAEELPAIGAAAHDDLVGFHLVVPGAWRDLPWNWLHNSLHFLQERHPLCWSGGSARLPAAGRPWMERLNGSRYVLDADGNPSARAALARLRADRVGRPDILFVAGHSEEVIRSLIYREADAIAMALAGAPLGPDLAHLELPEQAVTPCRLRAQALAYQAIHYAGPTSQPSSVADLGNDAWLENLLVDALTVPDAELDGAVGLETAPVGVDQITAMLDEISERVEAAQDRTPRHLFGRARTAGNSSWLLDDGPVAPEQFGRGLGLPPLVFSNSHCALIELGARLHGAGASTVVGPVAPVFSRPARHFAGHFYQALGSGWCVGAAVWSACRALRDDLGVEHPGWLSYGVQGFGSLSLHYL
jgi:hypothetical protein